jgi:hypothetical protein
MQRAQTSGSDQDKGHEDDLVLAYNRLWECQKDTITYEIVTYCDKNKHCTHASDQVCAEGE